MSKKRISFIKVGFNSYLNLAVENFLRASFPDHQISVFDVTHDLFGGRFRALAAGAKHALRQYGLKALRSRNSLLNNFYTTGYFHAVRRLVREKINSADFEFSFQTQSLFDASIPGLPHFVYTDHTHLTNLTYPGFDPGNLAPSAWIELEREIYKNAAMVFTMSAHVSKSLVEQYSISAKKTLCVYAGSNLEKDAVAVGCERSESKNILFTGRDWRRKGGPELLAAFSLLKARHPEATLSIVGCQPDQPLPEGATALGSISRAKLVDCYRSAALFCLPTRLEPFGLAILEAMSFGLPVVATNIGAVPDMVEHGQNGLLLAPGDTAALSNSLCRLLENPALRAEYGKRGRALLTARYTWEAVGRRVNQAITGYLKQSATGGNCKA